MHHSFNNAKYSIFSLEKRKVRKNTYSPAALRGSTFFLSVAGAAANYIMDWHQNALPDHILKEFGFSKIALELEQALIIFLGQNFGSNLQIRHRTRSFLNPV